MHSEYSVFMYNVMCKHLDDIPKKLKYLSPGTNFLQ